MRNVLKLLTAIYARCARYGGGFIFYMRNIHAIHGGFFSRSVHTEGFLYAWSALGSTTVLWYYGTIVLQYYGTPPKCELKLSIAFSSSLIGRDTKTKEAFRISVVFIRIRNAYIVLFSWTMIFVEKEVVIWEFVIIISLFYIRVTTALLFSCHFHVFVIKKKSTYVWYSSHHFFIFFNILNLFIFLTN